MENTQTNHPGYRFWVLVVMVAIAGFAQGMLLPLLAIMLEQIGVPPSLNGLNAAALYIGVLLIAPFIEQPVRRFGYKPVAVAGLFLMIVSIILFPFWQVFWFWFMLRIIVGIGDNMLHFATQVWITSTSPEDKRGRNIAIYGLFFGLGFGIGPLMTRLLEVNEFLPFIIATGTSLLAWLFLLGLRNEYPDNEITTASKLGTWSKYRRVLRLSWFALLPGFGYGFLEASLHGSFPIYALRVGITIDWVSILLPAFVAGSIVTQLPLGMLSDRVGRKKILLAIICLGFLFFGAASFVESNMILLLTLFALAGGCVGSLFSLGITYMADLLPKSLLPTGNVMAGISFALGSIFGPLMGGITLEWFEKGSIYLTICGMLLFLLMAGVVFREQKEASNQRVTE
ncbi:MFS transporter [Bacillus horti]|uniref:MFS family permease n=1 Tax=Caldalkalibacillus horti TaxID=77523 RepID=A0ABT9VUA7_9BACI|nr:MFS transporter [Bacillus horti]MDQ0164464.1 MFS family permease [Bacillus horti]